MASALNTGWACAALALCLAGAAAAAEPERERSEPARAPERAGEARPHLRQAEPHPGPQGYQRPVEPQGWNARPGAVDRPGYQHNFQAARSYRIGPYQRPPGWVNHHWGYGEVLPRGYWAAQYVIADYWLFGLEVPPAEYEWVRVGPDALLVSVVNGEILQVEYGVFA